MVAVDDWKAGCSGKAGFLDSGKAHRLAKAYGIHAYRCRHCPYWHVGGDHSNPGQMDRKRIRHRRRRVKPDRYPNEAP